MVEQVVQGILYVLHAALARRQHRAPEQVFLALVMKKAEHLHGVAEVGQALVEAGTVTTVGEPGKHPGKFADIVVVVGGDGAPLGVGLLRAVRVEFEQADGKQLHDLPGVILIRVGIELRVGLGVVDVAEVDTHGRVQGHRPQQVTEIAEGMGQQGVLVVAEGVGKGRQRIVLVRYHQDFAEREGDPLAQHIRRVDCLLPPGQAAEDELDIVVVRFQFREIARALAAQQFGHYGLMAPDGQPELLLQPRRLALFRDGLDRRVVQPECGSGRQPGGARQGRQCRLSGGRFRGWGRGRCRGGGCRRGQSGDGGRCSVAPAAASTAGIQHTRQGQCGHQSQQT